MKNEKINILNDVKSFSSLKKFTIFSVLCSIFLLFMPWVGDINPINLVEFKNEFFDIIDVNNIPLTLNLFFYFGYIIILFLVVSLFKIYKSDYKFASSLHFFNIIALVLVIASNLFYAANGEYENWIENEIDKIDKIDKKYSEEFLVHEFKECFDHYGISEDKMKDNPSKIIAINPFLFALLFLVNWILIARLSRRERLKSD